METVKDFFQSILNNSKERIESPFIGSFILSFIFFNWEMFAILFFSDWPVHCKIEWIRERYYQTSNFLIPLGFALFYILILPYLNIFFDFFLSTATRIESKKATLIHENKLLIEEREAHQRRKIADAEAGTSQIIDLKERNDALQSELNELSTQNQEDLKRHNLTAEKYKDRIVKLLNDHKALQIFSKQDWAADLDIVDTDLDISTIRDVIKIVDSFSEDERKKYLNFVTELTEKKNISHVLDMPKYEELGLISVYEDKKVNETHLTRKGVFLANYIHRGLDLM